MKVWESIVAINVKGTFGGLQSKVTINTEETDLGNSISALYQSALMSEQCGNDIRSHERYLKEVFQEYLETCYGNGFYEDILDELEDEDDIQDFKNDRDDLFDNIHLLCQDVITLDITIKDNLMYFDFEF